VKILIAMKLDIHEINFRHMKPVKRYINLGLLIFFLVSLISLKSKPEESKKLISNILFSGQSVHWPLSGNKILKKLLFSGRTGKRN
jgi:hypothetical protein